jgi:hypothetical protein
MSGLNPSLKNMRHKLPARECCSRPPAACAVVLAGHVLLVLLSSPNVLTQCPCANGQVTASRFAGAEEEEGPGGSSQQGAGGAAAGAGGAAAMVRARGKVISALMKRHLVESVVPVLVELRRLLMEVRHPLLPGVGCFSATRDCWGWLLHSAGNSCTATTTCCGALSVR